MGTFSPKTAVVLLGLAGLVVAAALAQFIASAAALCLEGAFANPWFVVPAEALVITHIFFLFV